MAEAYPLEKEYEPFMPHLAFTQEEMDRYHPSISAAEDIDEDMEQQNDLDDEVYQRGLVIVEEIRGRMKAEGRRRCEDR